MPVFEQLALEHELIELEVAHFLAHRRLCENHDRVLRVLDAVACLVGVFDAHVDGAAELHMHVIFRDRRLRRDRNHRLLEAPLVCNAIDERDREAEPWLRSARVPAEALDLPLFGLWHHQHDRVPVATIVSNGDVALLLLAIACRRAMVRAMGGCAAADGDSALRDARRERQCAGECRQRHARQRGRRGEDRRASDCEH